MPPACPSTFLETLSVSNTIIITAAEPVPQMASDADDGNGYVDDNENCHKLPKWPSGTASFFFLSAASARDDWEGFTQLLPSTANVSSLHVDPCGFR